MLRILLTELEERIYSAIANRKSNHKLITVRMIAAKRIELKYHYFLI